MKKKLKYPYSLTLYALAFTFSACSGYLDAIPDKSIQSPKTIADYQALLDHDAVMNRYTPDIGIISSDELYLTDANYNARMEYERSYYRWGHDATLEAVPNSWSRTYSAIFYANTAIDGLQDIPVTVQNKTDWETCMGSALFFRGKYHLQAATLWAKAYDGSTETNALGIPLRYTPDIYEATVRSSIADTYRQILADLTSAAALLPETVPVKTRPSKSAAFGYLARVGLAMGDYEMAAAYADSCLSLQSDLIDYNTLLLSGANPFAQFNEEVIIHFACEKPLHNTFMVNPSLYAEYAAADLRRPFFFQEINENEIRFVGAYDNLRAAYPFTGLTTAEMWLTRAEGYALMGDNARAVEDLNQLMKNRYGNGTFAEFFSDDNKLIISRIRDERRKELIFRDMRWFDLKRLNRDGENIVLERMVNGDALELPPNSNKYALPIPAQIIDASGISQNPSGN